MWKLGHKEGWVPKNWCFQIVGLEKTLVSPLDSKEIKPVNLKGNQPWIFIEWTTTEAPIFWLPEVESWLIGKVPDAGKDWGEEEKRASEDETAGWHHRCNGHELGRTLGDGRDREAWRAAVHVVAKSQTTERLSKSHKGVTVFLFTKSGIWSQIPRLESYSSHLFILCMILWKSLNFCNLQFPHW